MSQQILGKFKEFLIIERKELENIENSAKNKMINNSERILSESYVEAKAILDLINWIKENNLYNKGFEIKS